MAEQEQIRRIAGRGPASAGPNSTMSEVMTPKEIISILRRHVLLIVTLTVFGLVVGGVGWYLLKKYDPKYTAETYIEVLPPAEKEPFKVGEAGSTPQVEYGYRQTVVRLITQKNNLMDLINREEVKTTQWYSDLIMTYGPEKGKDKAVKDLEKHFGVVAEREASFVRLSMSCGVGTDAANIVNSMIDMFIASQGSVKRGEIEQKLSMLTAQQETIKRDIASNERAMDEIRAQKGINDLDEHQYIHPIEAELTRLVSQQRDLTLTYSQLDSMLTTQEVLATGKVTEQIERMVETDSLMNMLTQQIALLEAQLAAAGVKFGENHRAVQKIKETIEGTKQEKEARRIFITELVRQSNLQEAQQKLAWLAKELEAIAKQKDDALKQKESLDLARISYNLVKTTRDERQVALDQIKSTIEQYRAIHDSPEAPKVRRVADAVAPKEVSFPRAIIFFPGGMMLGLFIGLGLSFLVELLNDLVRTPRDIGRFLHISVLGVIPDLQEDVQIGDIDSCQVVRKAPYSMISESYRRFRTNLKLTTSAKDTKVLLITSPLAGDGKTSIAVNLATSFIAENKKVLLIDGNFWQPNLYKIFPNSRNENEHKESGDDFGDQSEFGLSTLLAGLCGYQEVIRPSGIDNLDIIDTGLLPTNPAELLGGSQMEQLLKHQRANYDYIIIDGPPVLLVSDVKTLARLVDGTILVFNATSTRRGVAIRAIRELKEINAQTLGCVLIAVKALKGGYFTEQFKSHQRYQKLQLAHSI